MPKDKNNIRLEAESLVASGDFKDLDFDKMDAKELIHQLQVYSVELEMQNQELRITQEQLEKSRDEYEHLFNNAPVGYVITDENFNIIRLNHLFANQLEKKHQEILNKPLESFVTKESQDDLYFFIRNTKEKDEQQSCEIEVYSKSGRRKFLQLNSFKIVFDGKPNIRISSTDITIRKIYERNLEISQDLIYRLGSVVKIDDAADIILNSVLKIDGFDAGGIYLKDRYSENLHLLAIKGMPEEFEKREGVYTPESDRYQLILNNDIINVDYDGIINLDRDKSFRRHGILSLAAIKIEYDGKVIGSLNIASKSQKEIQPESLETLKSIAYQLGALLRRIELEEEEKEIKMKHEIVSDLVFDYVYYGIYEGNELKTDWIEGAFEKITGYSPDYITKEGHNWPEFIHPDDLQNMSIDLDVIKSKPYHEYEYRVFAKDGSTKWLKDYSKPVWNEDKSEIIAVIGAVQDITNRKQAEEILQDHNKFIQSLLNTTTNFIYVTNIQTGEHVYSNEMLSRILGYSIDEMINLSSDIISKLIYPDDLPMVEESLKKLSEAEENDVVDSEYRMIRKDGEIIWVYNQAMVYNRDDDGNVLEIIGSGYDITNRKFREKQLLLLNRLVQSSNDLFYIVDPQTAKFIFLNTKAHQVFGLSEEEMKERHVYDFDPEVNTPEKWDTTLNKLREKGRLVLENKYNDPDGDDFVLEIETVIINEDDNEYILCIGRDITERIETIKHIEESEQKYRAIVEQSHMGVLVIQADPKFVVFSNDTIEDILGYTSEQLYDFERSDFLKILHPDIQENFVKRLKSQLDGEIEEFSDEIKIFDKDGKEKWVQGYFKTISLQGESAVQGIFVDVTENREYRDRIQQSEELLKKVFDNISIGIVVCDMDCKVQMWNQSLYAITGISPDDSINKDLYEVVPGFIDSGLDRHLNELIETGRNVIINEYYYEDKKLRKDFYYFNIQGQALYGQNNEITGIILAIEDITERVKAQHALKESEEKLRNFMTQSNDGIAVINEKGKIVLWNKSYERISGLKPHEAIDRYVWDLFYDLLPKFKKNHENYEQFQQSISEFLTSGKYPFNNAKVESRIVKQNGNERHLQSSYFAFKTAKGYNLGVITRDITDQKIAEYVLRESENKLRQLNTTKDKFFSIIAHDLKNPLGSFRELLAFLYSEFGDLEEKEKLEIIGTISDTSKNLFSLLENLLQWSMAQTGALEFRPVSVNLSESVQKVINLLRVSSNKKSIEIINEINSRHIVFADKEMTMTILRNLISNAIKFTERDGKIKLVSFDTSKYIEIAVIDTGIGIAPNKISSLFEINAKNTSLGTEKEKGTGLGLILCKELIETNKGRIWVESNIGQGSTFKFTLLNDEMK